MTEIIFLDGGINFNNPIHTWRNELAYRMKRWAEKLSPASQYALLYDGVIGKELTKDFLLTLEIRFYEWSLITQSDGYNNSVMDQIKKWLCVELGIVRVKRPTKKRPDKKGI
jgi:hypothetical protein